MSTENTPEPPPATLAETSAAAELTSSRKSYRRKYRKIMVTFEEKMRESSSLFKDEQRIFDISQRLAEQTDQLLQMLVDINSCPQIPSRLRYDLTPSNSNFQPYSKLKQAHDEEEGHLLLRKARYQLQTGNISVTEYRDLEDSLLERSGFQGEKHYSQLLKSLPVSSASRESESLDNSNQPLNGFLTAKQKEQYLQGLDAFLDGTATTPRPHAVNSLGNRTAERSVEREREFQLRNPVSVYNWLRKHQPQVFLQDNETSTEKPAKSSGSRTSKRMANRDSLVKLEADMYDDDGIAVEQGAGGRGKRKRHDDDGGYRPKGGNSRPTKKKKEDAPAGTGRRGKKMSIDAK